MERVTVNSSPSTRLTPLHQLQQLPTLILTLQTRITQTKQSNCHRRQQIDSQLILDLDRIKSTIEMIKMLLIQYKQRDQSHILQTKLAWLLAYSRSIQLRAQVVTKELLGETYSKGDIEVLVKIQCV